MTMEQEEIKTPCDYVSSAKKSVLEKAKSACMAIAKCLKDCYVGIAESYNEERRTAGAEAPSESTAAKDESMSAAGQAEKTEEVKEEPEPAPEASSAGVSISDESLPAIEQREKTEEVKSDPSSKNKIKFKYYNPKAKEVKLTGDFNSWRLRSMAKGKDGIWAVAVDLAPGRYAYKYVVDGQYIKDNKNPKSEPDGYGGERSVLEVKAVQ